MEAKEIIKLKETALMLRIIRQGVVNRRTGTKTERKSIFLISADNEKTDGPAHKLNIINYDVKDGYVCKPAQKLGETGGALFWQYFDEYCDSQLPRILSYIADRMEEDAKGCVGFLKAEVERLNTAIDELEKGGTPCD